MLENASILTPGYTIERGSAKSMAGQVEKLEKHMTENENNLSTWVTPTFEVISTSMECTAYAAVLKIEDHV